MFRNQNLHGFSSLNDRKEKRNDGLRSALSRKTNVNLHILNRSMMQMHKPHLVPHRSYFRFVSFRHSTFFTCYLRQLLKYTFAGLQEKLNIKISKYSVKPLPCPFEGALFRLKSSFFKTRFQCTVFSGNWSLLR